MTKFFKCVIYVAVVINHKGLFKNYVTMVNVYISAVTEGQPPDINVQKCKF